MDKENIRNENNHCPYACDKGDWDTYCTKSGNCQYQKNIKDCNSNIISLCKM